MSRVFGPAKARATVKTNITAKAKNPGHVIAFAFQPKQEPQSKRSPWPKSEAKAKAQAINFIEPTMDTHVAPHFIT